MKNTKFFLLILGILTLKTFATASKELNLKGFLHLNNLNLEHYLKTKKYMLALFYNSDEVNDEVLKKVEMIRFTLDKSKGKVNLTIADVDMKEDLKIAKRFNVFNPGTIAYLANEKAVLFKSKTDELDYEGESLDIEEAKKELKVWLLKRVIQPSEPFIELDQIEEFRKSHDRTITYAGLKNKYYAIFRYVASSFDDIHFAHSFSHPVIFYNIFRL